MAKAVLGLALYVIFAAAALAAGTNPKNPSWDELTPEQREILAPIAGEWSGFDAKRKQKWLRITKRYPKMTERERERLQTRMREWVSLTPEQRSAARSRYREFEQLPPERKATVRRKWQEYQREREEEARAAEAARTARPDPEPGAEPLAPGSEALGLQPR